MTVAYQRLDLPNDVNVLGHFSAHSMTIPANTVRGSDVSATPADAIPASKLQHSFVKTYAQESTAVAAVERKVLHVVRGATATLRDFGVGSITVATGTGNAVFDLYRVRAGVLTTLLSGTITLDSGNAVGVLEPASGFADQALIAGDWVEFRVVSSAVGSGTKPVGVVAQVAIDEDYA